jgi:uncharacterized protein (TIGR03083 family)
MVVESVGALRRERQALLGFCYDLDPPEWVAASAAHGWRIQDVVGHLGSACHALFTPASLTILRSRDIERTNDVFVDHRRSWTPTRTLAEYERWSARVIVLAGVAVRTPLAHLRLPMAELGRFRAAQLLTGAMVFDHHTHLRFDMAPALGRPAPETDAGRVATVLNWMFAVLGNQLRSHRPAWRDSPVGITLHGPGRGDWRVGADGAVEPGPATDAAAQITGNTLEFAEWATQRVSWRERDVKIAGDEEYAARFLDEMNVV